MIEAWKKTGALLQLCLLSLLALGGCASQDAFHRDLQQWRESRDEAVAGPGGWLALVGSHPLENGRWTIGRGQSNDYQLPAGPQRFGVLVADGQQVWFEPSADFLFGPDGEVPEPVELVVGDNGVDPTVLRLDSLAVFVADSEDLTLRIMDHEAAGLDAFSGLQHFPADPGWRIEAKFHPNKSSKSVMVPVVSGDVREYLSPGTVSFSREGREHTLSAVVEPGEDRLFLIFADQTNGRTTYGGGRFVYATLRPDGTAVVDFNRSYNPPCVFTPHANCPLPPPGNRLNLEVTAGEMRFPADPVPGE